MSLKLIEIANVATLDELEELDMLETIRAEINVDYDALFTTQEDISPEKVLLSAVLERALMDLFSSDKDAHRDTNRRSAVMWFTSQQSTADTSFGFKQIVSYLNISTTTANKIVQLAKSIGNKEGPYYDLYTMCRSWSNRSVRCYN